VIERISEDKAKEVAKLYRAEASGLLHRALVLAQGDRRAAENLVQEAFEASVKQWCTVGPLPDQDRRRWLFKVLKRRAISHWRINRRILLDPELLDAALSTQMTDGDETAIQALDPVVIDQAWEEMKIMPPARYRVVYLAWQCGWTDREIADFFEIEESTVRVHRYNAVHQLRSLIFGDDGLPTLKDIAGEG